MTKQDKIEGYKHAAADYSYLILICLYDMNVEDDNFDEAEIILEVLQELKPEAGTKFKVDYSSVETITYFVQDMFFEVGLTKEEVNEVLAKIPDAADFVKFMMGQFDEIPTSK